jgi:hypothetical protein
MSTLMTSDPVSTADDAVTRDALLTLCHDLEAVGIWLYLQNDTTLIAGPPELVRRRPDLLQQLRVHKAALVRLLEDCLAVDTCGTNADDTRFARELCPDCQQSCYVIYPPRRLAVHRTPDNQAVCPGSERAQVAVAQTVLTAFITDRCVQRPSSVLTWYSLRGALQAWCVQRGWLLPPRPALLAWLDAHYKQLGDADLPRWAGLTLTIEEWLGDAA